MDLKKERLGLHSLLLRNEATLEILLIRPFKDHQFPSPHKFGVGALTYSFESFHAPRSRDVKRSETVEDNCADAGRYEKPWVHGCRNHNYGNDRDTNLEIINESMRSGRFV